MKKILTLLLVTFISQYSYSQFIMKFGENCNGTYQTEIDDNLSMCLDDSNTVVGECNCYLYSYKKWQSEIDKYYDILIKNINYNIKNEMIKSQKNWVLYRDSEVSASYEYYRNFATNRIDIYNYHIRMVDLNRKRATELKLYCENLNLK
jgi:uncharacterized protein YecT (DUF1311 family)